MSNVGSRVVVDRDGFAAVLAELIASGHELVGPTVQGDAIVLDHLRSIDELPVGIGDTQAPGFYRLRAREDRALFGFASSPHSHKRALFPPRVELVQIRRTAGGLAVETPPVSARKVALIGARGCDLAAVGILDRVLGGGPYPDSDYAARRDQIFVLAVHCGSPAGTCFCVSMETGPRARGGFDLGATEILDGEHRFLIEIATAKGGEIIERVSSRPAAPADLAAADAVVATAETRMGRTMPAAEVRALLLGNLEHPRWQQVADRCLGCANCTMSCPTCFCSNVDDTTDLSGDLATRTRRWDSCFTADFAYVHGGSARPSLRARYRQWMTHKLATWHDQFGTSGCVGCGRCITWCPVGIDITEEVAAIRATPGGS